MIPAWFTAAFEFVPGSLRRIQKWSMRVFVSSKSGKIASEFFLEGAVLIAVFPVLDVWIQKGVLSIRWIIGSEAVAIFLLALAVILASFEQADE